MLDERAPRVRTEHALLILAALLLPSLSLLPLGGVYLWEHGWLLEWALATLLVVGVVYTAIRNYLPKPAAGTLDPDTERPPESPEALDPRWSPLEVSAWADVRRKAAAVQLERLSTMEGALDVATETIELVAGRIHPGTHDAVWRFTLPEALVISERVSRRLGGFVASHVPFGDRLTVSQFLSIYRARHLVDVAGRVYDVWRVLRFMNPATAMTNEARERIGKALFTWGREHVTRRIASAYVEEVGRAAIDLYGGRLRKPVATANLTAAVGPAPAAKTSRIRLAEEAEAAEKPKGAVATARQAVAAIGRLIRAAARR